MVDVVDPVLLGAPEDRLADGDDVVELQRLGRQPTDVGLDDDDRRLHRRFAAGEGGLHARPQILHVDVPAGAGPRRGGLDFTRCAHPDARVGRSDTETIRNLPREALEGRIVQRNLDLRIIGGAVDRDIRETSESRATFQLAPGVLIPMFPSSKPAASAAIGSS